MTFTQLRGSHCGKIHRSKSAAQQTYNISAATHSSDTGICCALMQSVTTGLMHYMIETIRPLGSVHEVST
jgi:hypothetical protein